MKYACQTLFDITATETTGHYKSTGLLYRDAAGQAIATTEAWNRSRNQQRNWETLTQICGLRTQLFAITQPIQDSTGTRWMFEFETEFAGVYGPDLDPTLILRQDAEGVPMLVDLNNRADIDQILITDGPRQNIWFAPVSINTA